MASPVALGAPPSLPGRVRAAPSLRPRGRAVVPRGDRPPPLASAGFGEGGGRGTLAGKSASHAADHAAIVRLGEKMLEDAAGEDAAGDEIVDDDGSPGAARRVDEASAERLCRRIVEHAATFDALYASESLGP